MFNVLAFRLLGRSESTTPGTALVLPWIQTISQWTNLDNARKSRPHHLPLLVRLRHPLPSKLNQFHPHNLPSSAAQNHQHRLRITRQTMVVSALHLESRICPHSQEWNSRTTTVAGAASASSCKGRPFPCHCSFLLPRLVVMLHLASPFWFCMVLFFRLWPCNIFIHSAHVAYLYLRRLHTIVCFPFPVSLRSYLPIPSLDITTGYSYARRILLKLPLVASMHTSPSTLSASVHSKIRPSITHAPFITPSTPKRPMRFIPRKYDTLPPLFFVFISRTSSNFYTSNLGIPPDSHLALPIPGQSILYHTLLKSTRYCPSGSVDLFFWISCLFGMLVFSFHTLSISLYVLLFCSSDHPPVSLLSL